MKACSCENYNKLMEEETVGNRESHGQATIWSSVTGGVEVGCNPLRDRKFKLYTWDIQKRWCSLGSVNRSLKSAGIKPYKYTFVQELTEDDKDYRLEFCNWRTSRLERWSHRIVFSDESTFYLNGQVNKHNLFYYATENEHRFKKTAMKSTGITVWAAVSYMLWYHFRHHGLNNDQRTICHHSSGYCITFSLGNAILSTRQDSTSLQLVVEKLVGL